MNKRETPRDVARPNVISVDLPTGGIHHFRIPSMLTVAKILKGAGAQHLAALLTMGKMLQDGKPERALAMVQRSGSEGLAMVGAMIGVSWYHATQDLETERQKDMLVYGEEIYEELHDAGYDTVKLMLIAAFLAKTLSDTIEFDKEVADRLGFSSQTTEPLTS